MSFTTSYAVTCDKPQYFCHVSHLCHMSQLCHLVWVRAQPAHCTDVPLCHTDLICSEACFRPEDTEEQTFRAPDVPILSMFFYGIWAIFLGCLRKAKFYHEKFCVNIHLEEKLLENTRVFAVRNTEFHLRSVSKKHSVFLIIHSKRTLRQKQKEETV